MRASTKGGTKYSTLENMLFIGCSKESRGIEGGNLERGLGYFSLQPSDVLSLVPETELGAFGESRRQKEREREEEN